MGWTIVRVRTNQYTPAVMARFFPSLAAINSGPAAEETQMAVNTESNEPGKQGIMFPDLDASPESKAIVKLAKQLLKIRTESKAAEDEAQERLVKRLHAAGIVRFSHDGLKVELVQNSEKVKIKPDPKDEDENEGDDQ